MPGPAGVLYDLPMKKQAFPILLLSLLISLSLSMTGCSKGWNSKEIQVSREIWVITDVHFLSGKLRDRGEIFTRMIEEGDGKNTLQIDRILSAFYKKVKGGRPVALLVTGDLTFNGEKLSHLELADFFKKIESLGTEVYVIPGNHDILNPWARKITEKRIGRVESVTPDEFTSFYGDFGYGEALSRDENSLSYLIEPVEGIQILMLDTCRYENNLTYDFPVSNGVISQETRAWIEQTVREGKAEGKEMMAAMHHPLLEHNIMVSDGFTIDDNRALVDFFSSLHVYTILTGHIHIQDIMEETVPGGKIVDITTNSLSVYPHNYGVISRENDRWNYRAVSLADEGTLFSEKQSRALRDFFIGTSDSMVRKALEESSYSQDEIDEMSRILSLANLNFFSGRESREDFREEGLNLFRKDPHPFLYAYLDSILDDGAPGDQSVDLEL